MSKWDMRYMTSHELANELLKLPDVPVFYDQGQGIDTVEMADLADPNAQEVWIS